MRNEPRTLWVSSAGGWFASFIEIFTKMTSLFPFEGFFFFSFYLNENSTATCDTRFVIYMKAHHTMYINNSHIIQHYFSIEYIMLNENWNKKYMCCIYAACYERHFGAVQFVLFWMYHQAKLYHWCVNRMNSWPTAAIISIFVNLVCIQHLETSSYQRAPDPELTLAMTWIDVYYFWGIHTYSMRMNVHALFYRHPIRFKRFCNRECSVEKLKFSQCVYMRTFICNICSVYIKSRNLYRIRDS